MKTKMNTFFTSVSLLGLLILVSSGANADFVYTSERGMFGGSEKVQVSENQELVAELKKKQNGERNLKIAIGNGALNSVAASRLFSQEENGEEQAVYPPLDQIPVAFFIQNSKNPPEIYAGLTELQPGSQIYVGALHVFKRKQTELLTSETINRLSELRPILVKNSNFQYLDLIIFAAKKVSEIELRNYLSKIQILALQKREMPRWKSKQIGSSEKGAVDQNSEGTISMVTMEREFGAHYFYLSDSNKNLSSTRSSGSLILSEDGSPLGVLQCKEKSEQAHQRGNETSDLFRALSLDFDLDAISFKSMRNLDEVLNQAESLPDEPNCIPVDKNGAGDM